MSGLKKIRSILEFDEIDKEQGVERSYMYYKDSSHHFHTEKQNVDILESTVWGKMLFLDGTLQSTTRDEIIYHSALVHPLMKQLSFHDSILILGGGEGATAREVLRWSDVKSVTMVDYDEELVQHMKETCKDWSAGAFEDPRLTVKYDDAWEFIKQPHDYDGVIVDLTDPSPSSEDWTPLIQNTLLRVAKRKGSVVVNCGLYTPWQTWNLILMDGILHKAVELAKTQYTIRYYTVMVPSFNGDWTMAILEPADSRQQFEFDLAPWLQRLIRTLPRRCIQFPAFMKPTNEKIEAVKHG